MAGMKEYRVAKGISQAELARRCKLNQTHVGEIERGVRQPWPKARRAIASVLGVRPHELWPELEKPPKGGRIG